MCAHHTHAHTQVRQLLDSLQFSGGGSPEVCLTEAFAEAVYLQSLPSALTLAAAALQEQAAAAAAVDADMVEGSGENAASVKLTPRHSVPCHCLLVTVSEPHRFYSVLPLAGGTGASKASAAAALSVSSQGAAAGSKRPKPSHSYTHTDIAAVMKVSIFVDPGPTLPGQSLVKPWIISACLCHVSAQHQRA